MSEDTSVTLGPESNEHIQNFEVFLFSVRQLSIKQHVNSNKSTMIGPMYSTNNKTSNAFEQQLYQTILTQPR